MSGIGKRDEATTVTVFNLTKHFASKPYEALGDFETVDQAKEKMLEHFVSSSKRGKYYYSITELGKTTSPDGYSLYTRILELTNDGPRQYDKDFYPEELKALTNMTKGGENDG